MEKERAEEEEKQARIVRLIVLVYIATTKIII